MTPKHEAGYSLKRANTFALLNNFLLGMLLHHAGTCQCLRRLSMLVCHVHFHTCAVHVQYFQAHMQGPCLHRISILTQELFRCRSTAAATNCCNLAVQVLQAPPRRTSCCCMQTSGSSTSGSPVSAWHTAFKLQMLPLFMQPSKLLGLSLTRSALLPVHLSCKQVEVQSAAAAVPFQCYLLALCCISELPWLH